VVVDRTVATVVAAVIGHTAVAARAVGHTAAVIAEVVDQIVVAEVATHTAATEVSHTAAAEADHTATWEVTQDILA